MIALMVFIGGGLGSLSRWAISVGLENYKSGNFPLATLIANILSCIVIGLAVGYFADKLTHELKALIVIGFCGGFSTFSTFSSETLSLLKSGNYVIAFLNILISISLCLFAIYAAGMLKK